MARKKPNLDISVHVPYSELETPKIMDAISALPGDEIERRKAVARKLIEAQQLPADYLDEHPEKARMLDQALSAAEIKAMIAEGPMPGEGTLEEKLADPRWQALLAEKASRSDILHAEDKPK